MVAGAPRTRILPADEDARWGWETAMRRQPRESTVYPAHAALPREAWWRDGTVEDGALYQGGGQICYHRHRRGVPGAP